MVGNPSVIAAPGLSVAALIALQNTQSLEGLIGSTIIDVLKLLAPDLASQESLCKLATRLIDPASAVRDPDQLAKLLALLPLAKANELGKKIGVPVDRQVYDRLKVASRDKAFSPAFRSFFGIVEDPRAVAYSRQGVEDVSASYALFDHQRRAARRVTEVLSQVPRKVVLHMPTGAGKTRTAMHIVAEHLAASNGTLVCWLAQSAELLEQAADEFARAWAHLGNRTVKVYRFWGDYDTDLSEAREGLIVAGLSKMHALSSRDPMTLLRLGDRTSLTVMDEAHQAIARTYRALITGLHTKRPGNGLLGLTATPGRTWADIPADAELSAFFDNAKVTLEVEGYDDPVDYLIEEGYLARPSFRTLNAEAGFYLSDQDRLEMATSLDIPGAILERLGDDVQRNLRIVTAIEDLMHRHKRIIVFAASVGHARMLSVILLARGHESDVVTGETESGTRERTIRRFKSPDPQPMVLCNYGVLTTGFDAPATSAAVIARPTKSLVLYSQMVGRATRGPRAGGNASAEIITVVDPDLPGFGSVGDAFMNWEDVWNES